MTGAVGPKRGRRGLSVWTAKKGPVLVWTLEKELWTAEKKAWTAALFFIRLAKTTYMARANRLLHECLFLKLPSVFWTRIRIPNPPMQSTLNKVRAIFYY